MRRGGVAWWNQASWLAVLGLSDRNECGFGLRITSCRGRKVEESGNSLVKEENEIEEVNPLSEMIQAKADV